MADTILVVDDEEDIREICTEVLRDAGYEVCAAATARDAMEMLAQGGIDVVLTDLRMPDISGLELLNHVKQHHRWVDVILMTAHATVANAVEAIKLGAYDYLMKPFGADDLCGCVARVMEKRQLVVENRLLRQKLQTGSGLGELVGASAAMERVARLILKLAPRRQPVLITGESGTGKELAARALHEHGADSGQPFVPVDCGALSASLIESELFGHVSGAFTGATQRRQGLLVSAGRGTLFLDEIGELPLELQAKLLRAIQEREFRALGSNERHHFEARIVAATNRDLGGSAAEGKFRSDLYYRLNVLSIHLPPLRERKGDIPALAQHFLDRERRPGDPPGGISREALARLMNYDWPGNVRELQNHILRAAAASEGPVIQVQDLAPELRGGHAGGGEAVPKLTYLEQLERKAILEMLQAADGNRLHAAKLLGISKTTMYKKLKDYRLEETI
jgi:DNA-binding NtrC family response regulator